jgi:hypothetical protein
MYQHETMLQNPRRHNHYSIMFAVFLKQAYNIIERTKGVTRIMESHNGRVQSQCTHIPIG